MVMLVEIWPTRVAGDRAVPPDVQESLILHRLLPFTQKSFVKLANHLCETGSLRQLFPSPSAVN